MIKLKILIISLLIAHYSQSQTDLVTLDNNYPQVRLIGGDTIFLFTHKQVKEFEKTYTRLDECKEIEQSLNTEISLLNTSIDVCDEQVENERNKVKLINEISQEKENQNIILTSENKKQKKKIKLLKKTRTLFTIGGTVIGGVIGYLITTNTKK